MFDTIQNVIFIARPDGPPEVETLRARCLESASLWVLKRRANRPYLPPQRLPVVARVA